MSNGGIAEHANRSGEYIIDADFAGGNLIVERLDGDRVELRPDLRDTEGNWFYWCFRVRGAAGRTLSFRFTQQSPIGARGPAASFDGGRSWRWIGREAADDSSFSYTFPAGADEVRFGVGMTYTQAHLEAFLTPFDASVPLRREVLCHSRKGRPVERLRIGRPDKGPSPHHVLITARHHACEMMCSYAVEGILAAALGEDDIGRWFRDKVDLVIIPFVDQDGVEDGDQGKNRRPRDHNRDYDGQSVHPETGAIRQFVPAWLGEAPLVMLDLHCPWLRGGINELTYQVGQSDPRRWSRQQAFGQALASVRRGSVAYDPRNDLPFGQDWNNGASYQQGLSCAGWGARLPGIDLVSTLELPYANAGGTEVNQASARAFGVDLAHALKAFIEQG
jgi:hypothetical protein